jgi:hypothetical protein
MANKNESQADMKMETRFDKLMNPKGPDGSDLAFAGPDAKATYMASIERIKDAIQMKHTPDRVPVTIFPSMFPYTYAGMNVGDAMYDYDRCASGFKKFVTDFKPDIHFGAAAPGPGKFFEILDYKLYAWAGHGVAPAHSYQCLEGEYMKEDEYNLLINDPSFYFRNFYLPRVFGALSGWSMLPPLTGILEMFGVAYNFIPFGLPPVQASFKALFEAGAEALKWAMAVGGVDGELAAKGFPNILGGFTKAPFDVIGDTLRGTKGIMLDIYRQPEKLMEAMDRLVPLMIGMGIASAEQTGNPLIFIPLHKGADGFLSDEQYKKFYWPTLRAVIMGLIEAGCVPFPAAEGGYESRLDVIRDLPRGKTVWMFDRTDIIKAKKRVGDTFCVLGNVPSSMLALGTPEEVKAYCKKLIDYTGKGGGFILANGAFFDQAKPENLEAMIATAREHGKYR